MEGEKIYNLYVKGINVFRGNKSGVNTFITTHKLSNYLILSLQRSHLVDEARLKAFELSKNKQKQKRKSQMARWYWNRLPAAEFENVRYLIDTNQYNKLLYIHNLYKLSDYEFCCGDGVMVTMFNAFKLRKTQGHFDTKKGA